LVMMGTAASFHDLPCTLGAPGSSWLRRSSTPEREPDSQPLAAVMVKTLTEADGRPLCDRSTGFDHRVGHAWPLSKDLGVLARPRPPVLWSRTEAPGVADAMLEACIASTCRMRHWKGRYGFPAPSP
jgi:hypothetical protein